MAQFKMRPKTVKESSIEEYGRQQIVKMGWMCEKFTSPGKRSVPDRIISMDNGGVFFIEFKAPGKTPTKLQLLDHEKRRAMGFRVYVIDSKEGVDSTIEFERLLY